MNDLDGDWYTYLTEEFKVDRSCYKTADRVVVDCPKCWSTSVVRLNHLKEKIKRLGFYECSRCRKRANIAKVRDKFREKYGDINPFQLEEVKEKIRNIRKKKALN